MSEIVYVVNAEARFLAMFRDCLASAGRSWKIRCFEKPEPAIESAPIDHPELILADQNLPGMLGTAFFQSIRDLAPGSIRILLTDQADPKGFTYAHQHIAKPVSFPDLRAKVEKAMAAARSFRNPVVRNAVLALRSLPVLPKVYYDLLAALGNEHGSSDDVVDLLKQDAAICAGILRMVNSPIFAYGSEGQSITDLLQCVTLLGTERLKGAVLSHQLLKLQTGMPDWFFPAKLARHRWETADLAFTYARKMELYEAVARDAYLAGLLHDLGRLVLSTNLHEVYERICQQAITDKKPISEAEMERLTISQADVIGFLVSLWGMRESTAGALIYQERPWDAPNPDIQYPAIAVYLAHYTAHQQNRSEAFEQSPLNMEFLKAQQMDHLLPQVSKV